MAELVFQKARFEARRLLDVCWDGRFPVSLRPVTDELGAEVYSVDLGCGLSGVVSKNRGESARIVLNSRHVTRRRRCVWAHMLGHVVERSVIADDEYSFEELAYGHEHDLHEFFADEFAGALLMPAFAVEQLRINSFAPEKMAEYFNVTIDAVKKRIVQLRLS